MFTMDRWYVKIHEQYIMKRDFFRSYPKSVGLQIFLPICNPYRKMSTAVQTVTQVIASIIIMIIVAFH